MGRDAVSLSIEQVIELSRVARKAAVDAMVADLKIAGCTKDQIAEQVAARSEGRDSLQSLLRWAFTPAGAKAVVDAAGEDSAVPVQILVDKAIGLLGVDEGN